jgi:uncharacterized RDD family membrane protein YckC
MYSVSVRTSQNVVIQYPVASLGERIMAHIIDKLILTVYIVMMAFFFVRLKIDQPWIWILALGIPFLFLNLVFEIFNNGQTPGKMLFKIQVVRMDGSRASAGDYLLRWLFAIVDFGVFGGLIAVIIIAAGGKGQRLGDLVAGTTVVKLAEQKEISSHEIFITAEETYVPVFAQAIQLNSRDIELMQRALEAEERMGNSEPLERLMEKAKSQLGIQSDLAPNQLVRTLIKDHSHLTSK